MSYETINRWPVSQATGAAGEVQLNRHLSFDDYPEERCLRWNSENAVGSLKECRNIVVYIGSLKLGDYIMLNPTLNTLRAAFPSANITLMANPVPPVRTMLAGDGLVDSVFRVKGMKHRPWSLAEYLRWGRELKAALGRIDLLVDTERIFLPSLALRGVLHPKHTIGYCADSLFSDWKIDESGRAGVHDTFQTAVLLRRLGIPLAFPLHRLPIPPLVKEKVDLFFSEREMDRTIAIFPFTADSGDLKRWPADCFVELSGLLVDEGYSVVLMGSPQEMDGLERIRSKIGKGAFLSDCRLFGLSEDDSIYVSMACLKNCELSFSCMSGGGHLAAALGVRTLVFAPFERLDKFAPIGPNVWSLFCDIPCSPCRVRGNIECNGERWCVYAVSPRIVKEAMDRCIAQPLLQSLVYERSGVRAR